MNFPNKLTIFRIIMVLPFFVTMSLSLAYFNEISYYNFKSIGTISFTISMFIFTLSMFTDFLDGYLARKNNLVTTFGKLMDPIADKIITTTSLIFLSLMNVVPFYLTLIFILRDIFVDGFRNIAAKNNVVVSASIYGKLKTFTQTIGIFLIFFIFPFISKGLINYNWFCMNYKIILLNLFIFLSILFSLISFVLYFIQIKKYIKYK